MLIIIQYDVGGCVQGRREAERAQGQYFGPGPVCLKVQRGGGTHGLVG